METNLEDLNLIELLDLLEPAPEPEPVSWLPQTAGWIWLAMVVAIIAFYCIRRYVRYRRATAYRRAALHALNSAGNDPEKIALILRRAALAGFPRSRVASLTGTAWLEFLDSTMPGSDFANGPGEIIATASYQRSPPVPGLSRIAQKWIRKHTNDISPSREIKL